MFRALPCFIQLRKPNMVERCPWCSLTSMHYFTCIYSAGLLLGRVGNRKSEHNFVCLQPMQVIRTTDRERQTVTISTLCYQISVKQVKWMCDCVGRGGGKGVCMFPLRYFQMHHGPGTVTHWPTSEKEILFFFPWLDKHTEAVKEMGEGRCVK